MAFDDTEFEDSDVSGMRKQLGKLGKSNKDMAERLAVFEAKDLIASKGYTFVKPEELTGVPEDEREQRAKALHEERRSEREVLVRELLQDQYSDEDALNEAVDAKLSGTPVHQDLGPQEQVTRARTLGSLDARPAPADPRKVHAEDAIAAALSGPTKKK